MGMVGADRARNDDIHGVWRMETLRSEFPRHRRPRLTQQVIVMLSVHNGKYVDFLHHTCQVCMYVYVCLNVCNTYSTYIISFTAFFSLLLGLAMNVNMCCRFMSQAVFLRSPSDPTAENPPRFLEVYSDPEVRPSKEDVSGKDSTYVILYVHLYSYLLTELLFIVNQYPLI